MATMKTNQLMEINVGGSVIRALHGSMTVELNDVIGAANIHRIQEGKTPVLLADFLRRVPTKEYITELAKHLSIPTDRVINATGTGPKGKTYGPLNFALYMAQMLNTKLHVLVNQAFIEDRIFQMRDDGGYLNIALRNKVCELPDRLDKDNGGMCTQVNIKIKANINPTGGNWNTATAQELNRRVEMENFLIRGMDMGFINSKEALWTAIEKF